MPICCCFDQSALDISCDKGLKYKLIQYKMAEFKDGIPILIQLFEVDKYRFCK
jgi:hypothetical protein